MKIINLTFISWASHQENLGYYTTVAAPAGPHYSSFAKTPCISPTVWLLLSSHSPEVQLQNCRINALSNRCWANQFTSTETLCSHITGNCWLNIRLFIFSLSLSQINVYFSLSLPDCLPDTQAFLFSLALISYQTFFHLWIMVPPIIQIWSQRGLNPNHLHFGGKLSFKWNNLLNWPI